MQQHKQDDAPATAATPSEQPAAAAAPRPSTGWRVAFQRAGPHDPIPEPPEALRAWTAQTVYGLLGGSLLGGYNGLRLARTDAPSPVPHNSKAHRAALFFVRESVLTGARVGAFASLFSAFALVANDAVGIPRPADYAVAGAATCLLFGAAAGGLRSGVPAAGFGVVAGGLGGLALQAVSDAAERYAPPQVKERAAELAADWRADDPDEKAVDGGELVARVISRFERTLPNFARGAAISAAVDAEPKSQRRGGARDADMPRPGAER